LIDIQKYNTNGMDEIPSVRDVNEDFEMNSRYYAVWGGDIYALRVKRFPGRE